MTDIARELTRHFGKNGVRRFGPAELTGLEAPKGEVLSEIGMPTQVGPYFRASTGVPLGLGAYAGSVGVQIDGTHERWVRIGHDNGAEISVDPSGQVQAVFLGVDEPPVHVASSVEAFAAGLLALDAHLPQLAAPGPQEPAAIFRNLRDRLTLVDAGVLDDDEAWWPKVLEEIRHALSFPFSAAFEYVAKNGEKKIHTETARPDRVHPERLVWERLESQRVRPSQVTRVYTELEPCFLPGNYCAMWLTRFTEAEFSYSFDYGETAESREDGILDAIRHANENE
jgi:hypothetical protein